MSSIPNRHASAQVAALALTLSSYQRCILAKAGEARWFDLPHPWLPLPGSQEVTAYTLAAGDRALLTPVVGYLGAYELTALGEQVAGYYLMQAMNQDAVAAHARRLTPLQRSVLAQVGASGTLPAFLFRMREGLVARALASPDHQLLHALRQEMGLTYALSLLGEQVLDVLTEVVDAQ